MNQKSPLLSDQFRKIWQSLFSSPIHLDSALSKLPPKSKSTLAQIIPQILLRPSSLAESLGVGVPPNEPWELSKEKISAWRPAQLIAERIHEMMAQGRLQVDPVRDDFPREMVEEWESYWGEDTSRQLIDVLGREAPLSLRSSYQLGSAGQGPRKLIQELNTENKLPVRAEVSDFVPYGVRLSGYAPVLRTQIYEKGGFEIQDEGSQFMALFALWPEKYGSLLQETPGPISPKADFLSSVSEPSMESSNGVNPKVIPRVIIDACAGAGGKSLAMSDAVRGKGRIYSYDMSLKKLQALRRRVTRAGLNNVQTVLVKEGAETEVIHKFKGSADVVLVDAPCSGWGVLRRNPDIKWRQEKDVLSRMPEIQYRLLSLYSVLVAPGGRLVYGVCTFRPAETREIILKFIKEYPEFELKEGGFLGPGPCDGFFMQTLTKKS